MSPASDFMIVNTDTLEAQRSMTAADVGTVSVVVRCTDTANPAKTSIMSVPVYVLASVSTSTYVQQVFVDAVMRTSNVTSAFETAKALYATFNTGANATVAVQVRFACALYC